VTEYTFIHTLNNVIECLLGASIGDKEEREPKSFPLEIHILVGDVVKNLNQ
jgi:hypothetical protein